MNVLGIHDGHNASAALFVDGTLAVALAEERFTRRKMEYGFPFLAAEACLQAAGLCHADLDHVALATVGLPPRYVVTKREAVFSVADWWREQEAYWKPVIYDGESPRFLDVFADKVQEDVPYDMDLVADENDHQGMLAARLKLVRETFGVSEAQTSVHDHQACHSHYGFLAAPLRDRPLLIVTTDGGGDGANGSLSLKYPGKQIEEVMRTDICNLGRLYRYFTLLLGMKPGEHEFKLMGLAPYANAFIGGAAYEVVAETLQVEGLEFTYKVKPEDHFWYFKERLQTERFDGIAYAIQRRLEELMTQWVGNAVKAFGIGDVVLSGGVSMNVKANQRLMEMEGIDSLWVPPGAGDESISAGAACQFLMEREVDAVTPLAHAYLGNQFTAGEVERAVADFGLPEGTTVVSYRPEEVAEKLEKGAVFARFDGSMEFGPRALGNRSILADPRNYDVIRIINSKVKKRDFWMPFCPSILAERADDYLVNPKGIGADYMTVAFESTELGQKSITAGLHPYDRTARPQIVRKTTNPGYHDLISAFEARTGVGCLLNTSFNIHGEPVVASPTQALDTFVRSGLEYLILGRLVIGKPGLP